eukprot:3581528-Prymnesium_polylepis.1
MSMRIGLVGTSSTVPPALRTGAISCLLSTHQSSLIAHTANVTPPRAARRTAGWRKAPQAPARARLAHQLASA